MPDASNPPVPAYQDELDVLNDLVPLGSQRIIELGCGAAGLARSLLKRFPQCRVTGLEVDEVQQAKNFASPQEGLEFITSGAQSIPFPDASFDLAMMLKSLHHVPLDLMGEALGEAARVLKKGGHLYISEPVYGGAFNDIIKTYNDEGAVRAAAQGAVDVALLETDHWANAAELRFTMPVRYGSFDEFERKHMHTSFATYSVGDTELAAARAAWDKVAKADGILFNRIFHVRLLRRR